MSILERVTEVPTTPQPDIVIEGVSKRFGRGRVILSDVTLHVEALELVCLLGASGCGKSTLLNLVAGLDRPSSGTVTTAGGRPSLMFQESALLPWLTAAQNIELALKLEHVGRVARRERAQVSLRLVRDGDIAMQKYAAATKLRTDKAQVPVGGQPQQEFVPEGEKFVAFGHDAGGCWGIVFGNHTCDATNKAKLIQNASVHPR
jgi:ABC-type sugar transport system ATPase subunit